MLWRAEKPLRGWLGLGTLFDPLKIPAAHFYPQLDFSELSCLLYLVCHCLKVLLLKIWLWPDLLCTVRCFGFCHGFVYFHVILKLLKIMYPHGISSRQKPVLWLACIICLSWKKLLLRLLKYLRPESYRRNSSPLSAEIYFHICHEVLSCYCPFQSTLYSRTPLFLDVQRWKVKTCLKCSEIDVQAPSVMSVSNWNTLCRVWTVGGKKGDE